MNEEVDCGCAEGMTAYGGELLRRQLAGKKSKRSNRWKEHEVLNAVHRLSMVFCDCTRSVYSNTQSCWIDGLWCCELF